jgi:hypothetical protein
LGARLGWSVGYAFASVEDRFGVARVPRAIDQPHALNLGLDVNWGERWRAHADWNGHSGWPTTALSAQVVEQNGVPTVIPVLGSLYGERQPAFHRIDLRLSREQVLPRGVLTLFLDVLNAYDRKNVRGYEIDLAGDSGGFELERSPLYWTPRLFSIGARWEF